MATIKITVSKEGTRDFSDPRGALMREHAAYIDHLREQIEEARLVADKIFAARLEDYRQYLVKRKGLYREYLTIGETL